MVPHPQARSQGQSGVRHGWAQHRTQYHRFESHLRGKHVPAWDQGHLSL